MRREREQGREEQGGEGGREIGEKKTWVSEKMVGERRRERARVAIRNEGVKEERRQQRVYELLGRTALHAASIWQRQQLLL